MFLVLIKILTSFRVLEKIILQFVVVAIYLAYLFIYLFIYLLIGKTDNKRIKI
jgi:hypothetical protein